MLPQNERRSHAGTGVARGAGNRWEGFPLMGASLVHVEV